MPSLETVTILGAAGVAIWVIWLIVKSDPGLHSNSEVDGLREDKKLLFEANALKDAALAEANATLKNILEILQNEDNSQMVELLLEILARLPDPKEEGPS